MTSQKGFGLAARGGFNLIPYGAKHLNPKPKVEGKQTIFTIKAQDLTVLISLPL